MTDRIMTRLPRITPRIFKTSLIPAMVVILATSSASSVNAQESGPRVHIKDITTIRGEHPNTISGFGLVTGLAGTGGTTPTTKQFALLLLQKMGNRADPAMRENIQRSQEKTDNMSVVRVTVVLPPHAKNGQKLDALVSAFDNARSLNGGVLSETVLEGVDGTVYAIASGPVSLNGGDFGGKASSVTKNHPTTGRVPMGAIVEEEIPCRIFDGDVFHFLLRNPQYATADRMSRAINLYSPGSAAVLDPATVAVRLPSSALGDPHRFISECQELTVVPGNTARVVINERTGTIVFGSDVKLSKVAITHGNLIISTAETPEVSQPNAFSEGETTVVPRTSVDVMEQPGVISVIEETVTVGDLASSLNALGVSPRDLSSIFQTLKESGSLHAELELK
jgi:flagellar P-ring protein precursor FlgI